MSKPYSNPAGVECPDALPECYVYDYGEQANGMKLYRCILHGKFKAEADILSKVNDA